MFISFNGKLLPTQEKIINSTNRPFSYGDGLFETIRWQNNQPLFFESHLERLFEGMKYLQMKIPTEWTEIYFLNEIKNLLKKNEIENSARLKLHVFRNDGGFYTPQNSEISFVLTASSLENNNYLFNETGLLLGVFEKEFKTTTTLSNFKTNSALVYVLAGLFAKENRLDDCLVLNTSGNICDSISANVFIVKNKKLITPPTNEGCIDGVMRKEIMRAALMNKISCIMKPITIDDALSADEIFLTNAIKGIQWVGELDGIEYSNEISKSLFEIALQNIN